MDDRYDDAYRSHPSPIRHQTVPPPPAPHSVPQPPGQPPPPPSASALQQQQRRRYIVEVPMETGIGSFFKIFKKIIIFERIKTIFIHLKRLSCGCSRFPRPLCSFRSSSIFTATIRCASNALNSTTYSICYARRSSTSQSGSKWSSTA